VNVISKKKNEIEDSVEKSLDIFENEPLLFFVKEGKHLPGASANVVRRVNRLMRFYTWNGKDIKYQVKPGLWKCVPHPEKRVELVWNHLI